MNKRTVLISMLVISVFSFYMWLILHNINADAEKEKVICKIENEQKLRTFKIFGDTAIIMIETTSEHSRELAQTIADLFLQKNESAICDKDCLANIILNEGFAKDFVELKIPIRGINNPVVAVNYDKETKNFHPTVFQSQPRLK